MEVDVYFDPVCPWCYIGKRRLEAAIRLRPAARVETRWRPFLLNPEIPAGGIDRSAYLARKFGSEARVRRIYGAIADAGLSVEIDFAFDSIDSTPSSIDAHRLVRFAARCGKETEAVEALFYGYFIQGRDTGDKEVLAGIAGGLGLDAGAALAYLQGDDDIALIYEENAGAHRLGLNGVPAFVFDGGMAISGAQDPRILARVLDVARVGRPAA